MFGGLRLRCILFQDGFIMFKICSVSRLHLESPVDSFTKQNLMLLRPRIFCRSLRPQLAVILIGSVLLSQNNTDLVI